MLLVELFKTLLFAGIHKSGFQNRPTLLVRVQEVWFRAHFLIRRVQQERGICRYAPVTTAAPYTQALAAAKADTSA